jgi:glycerol uptake facilitator-like aquaporin
MFRKNVGRFSRWLGVAYIACQLIGAMGGALLAFMWTRHGGRLSIEADKYVFQAMTIEIVGSFFFVTMFLINTEANSKFFHDSGFRLLAISGAYVVAVSYSTTLAGGSINPAFGVTINLTGLMDSGRGDELKWIWLYGLMPFVGAALALLFHEFVFKKTQENIEEIEKQESRRSEVASYEPPNIGSGDHDD